MTIDLCTNSYCDLTEKKNLISDFSTETAKKNTRKNQGM